MKIYLAGPMRGIPEFNFPAFHSAAKFLREKFDFEVFSPAEEVNDRLGVDVSDGNTAGDESVAAKDHGFNLRDALGIDLAYITGHADGVAMLPGWEKSRGAVAEVSTAKALGLKLFPLQLENNVWVLTEMKY